MLHTKNDMARRYSVSPRTIDNWVRRGLIPPPGKTSAHPQGRVVFSDAHVRALDSALGLRSEALAD